MARELQISRSVMNENVKAGCPLASIEAARHWRRCNVSPKYYSTGIAARAEHAPKLEAEKKFTPAEWADLLASEFQRLNKASKETPPRLAPSFTPALTLGAWALAGCLALAGKKPDAKGLEWASVYVNGFLEAVRNGDGDEPFQGLRDGDELKN
jgi:hypothetical protein